MTREQGNKRWCALGGTLLLLLALLPAAQAALPVIAAGGGHSAAVGSDGSLLGWGGNASGQLGDGSFSTRVTPIQVGAVTSWAKISAGSDHTLAVRQNGALWAWGANTQGKLGDGSFSTQGAPVQIGALTSWSAVSAGGSHSLALRTNGSLWAWGANASGQLGDGSFASQGAPVQVGSVTTWTVVSAGGSHSSAIRADGTLWAWGANASGQLGEGSFSVRGAPVQVGGGTTWAAVSAGSRHTVALKADGTLWAWGAGSSGQLGNGGFANQGAPVQVGGATNWAAVAAGGSHTLALKKDGTLWAWGANSYGQLGDGSFSTQAAPVQVGNGNQWLAISGGDTHSLAWRSDGTVWAWGAGASGQVGDGDLTNRGTPVQVAGVGGIGTLVLPNVPDAPTLGSATAGDGQAKVSFTAPGNNGGAAILDYTVSSSPGGIQATGAGSPITVIGLTNGQTYTFTVTARNIAGSGAGSSPSNGVTPATPVPAVNLAPASLTFAGQNVSTTSASQAITLSNTGASTLTIASITVNADFGQSNNCSASLAAGAKCTISVTFTPTAVGARAGTLTVIDNAAGSPHTVSLSGTGLAATYTLTVYKNGSGTVTSVPTGINCGITCVYVFNAGTPVTLTAGGDSAYSLTGWGGACSGSGTCSLTLSTDRAVSANFTPSAVPAGAVTANLVSGWNLIGNGTSGTVDVAGTFGNAARVVSVWKWRTGANAGWAYYSPALADGGAVYAASKGYAVLTSINPGEGFWVNATTAFSVSLGSGSPRAVASFKDGSGEGGANVISSSWNLIAVGDGGTPRDFANGISASAPAAGSIATSLVSLWGWHPGDASHTAGWAYYSPTLDNSSGLTLFNVGKGYYNFSDIGKTLDPTTGFWVNHP